MVTVSIQGPGKTAVALWLLRQLQGLVDSVELVEREAELDDEVSLQGVFDALRLVDVVKIQVETEPQLLTEDEALVRPLPAA